MDSLYYPSPGSVPFCLWALDWLLCLGLTCLAHVQWVPWMGFMNGCQHLPWTWTRWILTSRQHKAELLRVCSCAHWPFWQTALASAHCLLILHLEQAPFPNQSFITFAQSNETLQIVFLPYYLEFSLSFWTIETFRNSGITSKYASSSKFCLSFFFLSSLLKTKMQTSIPQCFTCFVPVNS